MVITKRSKGLAFTADEKIGTGRGELRPDLHSLCGKDPKLTKATGRPQALKHLHPPCGSAVLSESLSSNSPPPPLSSKLILPLTSAPREGCGVTMDLAALKIWRKRLDASTGNARTKVTLNQVNGMGSSVTPNPIHCIQSDIPKVIETIHIRRSGGKAKSCEGQLPQTTCMSTREYLQKRCKTYDQNQSKGSRIDDYTYKSGECSKACPTIVIKPSNKEYKTQGGVSSSSRTNNLKYKTIQAKNVHANYATARSSLDFGRVNVHSQNPPPKVCLTVRQDRVHETSCPYVKR
jgi:hypothetical protein